MTRAVSLFDLRVRHDYHPDQVGRGLRITPTAATLRLLDRHRLLLRSQPDGLSVWAQTDADGQAALIALPRDQVFGFELSATDPAFSTYTDLQDFAGKADPVFRNRAAGPAGDLGLQLSDRETWASETLIAPAKAAKFKFALSGKPLALGGDSAKRPLATDFRVLPPAAGTKVTGYDAVTRRITLGAVKAGQQIGLRYRSQAPARRGSLAAIELRYESAMPLPDQPAAPFEIRFKARSARWAYYLFTDQSGEFSIVDAMPQGPALSFKLANQARPAPAVEEIDPLALMLAGQDAGLRRLRFLSDQPVPCSSATRRGIELRLGDQRVLGAMPNPSPANLSRLLPEPGAALPGQDIFYQLIRCLKAS